MDTVVYVDEQRMLRSDNTDEHANLDLPCLQIVMGKFALHYFVQVSEPQSQKMYFGHLRLAKI